MAGVDYAAAQTERTTGAAPRWLRGLFLANLIAQTAIVVTGGLVRVTGSGLGCPTWPECTEGSLTPTDSQAEAWHKYVEFGNRTLTFVLGILAIAALVGAIAWARRLRGQGLPGRRPVVLLAAVPLVGTFAQAILGGITVLTGLNPVTVALHFLLSAAIIAGTLLLFWRSGEPADQPVVKLGVPAVRVLTKILLGLGFLVLVLGTVVTGSGPHSGDADAASRFPFDAKTVAWLHADLVILFIGLTVGLLVALSVTHAPQRASRAVWLLLGFSLAQGVVGYVQSFTGLPWTVVALHLLGACLVWIMLVRVPLTLRTRGVTPASEATADQAPAADKAA
jgi:cytochrome c oxidase assembly protein subunit 15